MRILLDTHIIIWALTDNSNLSADARALINDTDNELYYSTVSGWEISLKHDKHPDDIPITGAEFMLYCKLSGYHVLRLSEDHVKALDDINRKYHDIKHRDPFDRMLLAQSKSEHMLFMTHDSNIINYDEKNILPV